MPRCYFTGLDCECDMGDMCPAELDLLDDEFDDEDMEDLGLCPATRSED